MKGNQIIVASEPRGRFIEGILSTSGTPKPGTIMQRKAATAVDGGTNQFTWTEYNRDADANRPAGAVAILLEKGEGYSYSDAYADGDWCFLYEPVPGEELNVLWAAAGTGTGDSVAIGDLGIADDGTGLIVDTTGSPETEMFVALEPLTDVVATGTLCWCEFTGY